MCGVWMCVLYWCEKGGAILHVFANIHDHPPLIILINFLNEIICGIMIMLMVMDGC